MKDFICIKDFDANCYGYTYRTTIKEGTEWYLINDEDDEIRLGNYKKGSMLILGIDIFNNHFKKIDEIDEETRC